MSYLINDMIDVFICGYNSANYAIPLAGQTHPIDTEVISSGQLNTSTYEFLTKNASYFLVGDYLGKAGIGTSYQLFDCKLTGHFQISEGYAVRLNVAGTINMDDAIYERADNDFDLETAETYISGGSLLAENTRVIGIRVTL